MVRDDPFQLIMIYQDGIARVWDVREAAMKRYSKISLKVLPVVV